MRNLTWLTLLALACNGEDTNDTDTGDTDTEPTIELSFESGETAYSMTINSTTVCNSTYTVTGEEYTDSFCDNCDFLFTAETTEVTNTDHETDCPNRDPWEFTLALPYPAFADDMPAGFGYVTDQWYYDGYGDLPFKESFTVFYVYSGTGYGWQILSGTYIGQTAEEHVGGTFTNTDGEIAWTYETDPFFSPRGAYIRNCSDRDDPANGDFLGNVAHVEDNYYNDDTAATTDDWVDYVEGTPSGTATGSFTCAPTEYAEAYTVSVAASTTLAVSVDVLTGANHFDPYIWVNDQFGCTVALADDQFQCTATECDDPGDTAEDIDPSSYSCCPSVEVENGASAQTYTIYVTSINSRVCPDAGDVGNYTIKVTGGTALTLSGDNLHPEIDVTASGSGTIVETTTP